MTLVCRAAVCLMTLAQWDPTGKPCGWACDSVYHCSNCCACESLEINYPSTVRTNVGGVCRLTFIRCARYLCSTGLYTVAAATQPLRLRRVHSSKSVYSHLRANQRHLHCCSNNISNPGQTCRKICPERLIAHPHSLA